MKLSIYFSILFLSISTPVMIYAETTSQTVQATSMAALKKEQAILKLALQNSGSWDTLLDQLEAVTNRMAEIENRILNFSGGHITVQAAYFSQTTSELHQCEATHMISYHCQGKRNCQIPLSTDFCWPKFSPDHNEKLEIEYSCDGKQMPNVILHIESRTRMQQHFLTCIGTN